MCFSSPSVYATIITHTISGTFAPDAQFPTGIEGGTFSGTFSYDLTAVDQDPSDPLTGVYDLADWSIDVLDMSGNLAYQLNSLDNSFAEVYVSPDPGNTFPADGNVSFAFFTETGFLEFYGLIIGFDLASVVSVGLPLDLTGATFADDGVFGLVNGGSSDDTPISSAFITTVPIPSALLLLISGLFSTVSLFNLRK